VRQSAERGKPLFRRYDYGTACTSTTGRPQACNRRMYGADEPPAYDISAIKGVPIAVFSGVQDVLADAVDVQTLLEALPPGTVVATQSQATFEHLDFTWGLSAARLVYPEVLELLGKYGENATPDSTDRLAAHSLPLNKQGSRAAAAAAA